VAPTKQLAAIIQQKLAIFVWNFRRSNCKSVAYPFRKNRRQR